MEEHMQHTNTQSGRDPKLRNVLREDLLRGDFRRTMRREFRDLKEAFLTDDRKSRLKGMKLPKRLLLTTWWLVEALVRKLTPARRLVVVF
jgi:hypothetical protein